MTYTFVFPCPTCEADLELAYSVVDRDRSVGIMEAYVEEVPSEVRCHQCGVFIDNAKIADATDKAFADLVDGEWYDSQGGGDGPED